MKTTQSTVEQVGRLTAASEWLLRLNDPQRSEQDIADWLAWCDAAPDNMRVFELIQADWHDLDALKPAIPSLPAQSGGSAHSAATVEFSVKRGLLGMRYGSFRWRQAAVVAIIATAAAISHYLYTHRPVQQYTASIANEYARLPDGSTMVLGARTHLDVDFAGAIRKLQLSAGEAYFNVSPDKDRPFIVQTGDINVTALGTAFNIRHNADRIVITVEDGAVRISSPFSALLEERRGEGPFSSTWHASAGHQLTYFIASRTATLAAVNPAMYLKWRNGELAYEAEILGNVIADVNRYSRRRIIVQDEACAALSFTGTVFVDAIDDWLTAIQQAYSLQAEHLPGGNIILKRTE